MFSRLFHVENKKNISLEKIIEKNKIPIEIDNQEDKTIFVYTDIYEQNTLTIVNKGNKYYLNSEQKEEEEIIDILKRQWEEDKKIIRFMNDGRYNDFFDITDFIRSMINESVISQVLSVYKDEILSTYKLKEANSDKSFIIKIGMDSSEKIRLYPTKEIVTPNQALINILNAIEQTIPSMTLKEDFDNGDKGRFSDIAKTYYINNELIKKLNKIEGVESHIIDIGRKDVIFIVFENDAALEYISPTKQHPNGQVLLIDYDDENRVEDFKNYNIVLDTLNLSTMIKNKPDENNMPKRKFSE